MSPWFLFCLETGDLEDRVFAEDVVGRDAMISAAWPCVAAGAGNTESESQSAYLLPVVLQSTSVRAVLPNAPPQACHIEIVIADAVVRVSTGTDAALLQLVLHSLLT